MIIYCDAKSDPSNGATSVCGVVSTTGVQTELRAVATIATATPTNSLSVWRFAVGGALVVAWLFLIGFDQGIFGRNI
jgi:hypothetical protein